MVKVKNSKYYVFSRLINDEYEALFGNVIVANSFLSRAKGLLGKKYLPEDSGLYISKCSSIHMFGMNFSIDVAFLDENLSVVDCVFGLKPWRVAACRKAKSVLEVSDGMLKRRNIQVGDQLKVEWRT